MKRKSFILAGIAGVIGIAGVASAQPALDHLQDIDVSGLETTPIGIAVDPSGSTAFVAGFGQRRVLKIEDFYVDSGGTPSILFRTSDADTPPGPFEWNANLGLYTIEYREVTGDADQLLVAGHRGTAADADGYAIILNPEDGSVIHQQAPAIGGTGRNIAGATFLNDGRVLTLFTQGSNFLQYNNEISALSGSGFIGGPALSNANLRYRHITTSPSGDVYLSQNDRFVGTGTNAAITRLLNDNGTPQNAANFTAEAEWYTTTITATGGSAQGVSVADIDGTEYAILSLREDSEIHFVNTSTGNADLVFTDASLEFPASARVATVEDPESPGEFLQYLLVSQYGLATGPSSVISVYGINGAELVSPATSVNNWNLY